MRKRNKGFILGLLVAMTTSVWADVLPNLGACEVARPKQAPEDFMWGLAAYHVPLPGYELYPEDFQKMAANGINWISVDFAWKRIEPVQGAQYNFTYFDMLTQEAAKNGIQIIGKLANGYNKGRAVSPEWTADLSTNDYLAAMDKYARAVVRRYGSTVKLWAMENELNVDQIHVRLGWRAHGWSDRDKDRIVQTLDKAIHQSGWRTKSILTVSTAPNFGQYIRSVGHAHYDMVGLFSYPANFLPITSNFDSRNGFCGQANTARKASGGKPVIMLETGFQTAGLVRTQQGQADYVQAAVYATLRAGMQGLFIYQYLDNPLETLRREQTFGLVDNDRKPKRAWGAYGDLIKAYSQP